MAFCSSCGVNLSSGATFCSGCGQPVASQAVGAPSTPVQPTGPSEQTFFKGTDVLVTNTRLVRGNETFAMSGVTSVSSFTEVPSKKGPIILIVIGALALLAGGSQSSFGVAFVGLVMIGLGVLWFRSIKNVYHVRLVTASGERDALSSRDREYVGKIVGAISQAIVHRG